jgi:ubiquinone/menaquinone biosynthesis C-methylase UbiE
MELKQKPEIEQIEKQKERWNSRAGKWDADIQSADHYANFEDGYQKFLILEKEILSNMKPVEAAIDLGCGTGQTTALLKGKAEKIYILDIAEEMLKETQKKVPEAIPLCASVTSVPLPDKSVDLAISRGIVLSHLPASLTGTFFSELGRIVRMDGKVIFDYLSNPDTASYQNQSPKIPFTMKEVTDSLEAQGFGNITFDGEESNRVVRVSADKIN